MRGIHRSRWIPRTKASHAELWCFLWINDWVNNRETPGWSLWRHRNGSFALYLIFISQRMLYCLHSTLVLSFYIDVILTLSIGQSMMCHWLYTLWLLGAWFNMKESHYKGKRSYERLIIPPTQWSCWGVYWFHSVRPSVRLSVRPSRIPCPLCSIYSCGWISFYIWHIWSLSLEGVSRLRFFFRIRKY